MRLLKVEGGQFHFQMTLAEKTVLFALLERYPLIPLSYYRLCRTGSGNEEAQTLLEEAMSSRREQLKRMLSQFVQGGWRIQQARNNWILSFPREHIELLLQVLNDIRVGNWIRLGCPDPDKRDFVPRTREEKHAAAEMELAAHFECVLLDAVEGTPA